MDSVFIIALASSFWLGVLTSISPCPLATNIAAVSFIGKNIESTFSSLVSGVLYALGRMLVYSGIAALVVLSAVSIPALSMFLQSKINMVLGPVLIITGIILLGLIKGHILKPVSAIFKKIADTGFVRRCASKGTSKKSPEFNVGGGYQTEFAEKLARKGPYIGSVLIGALFALAFCPVSAALFFGSMIPLSLKHQSFLTIPAVYGFGTAVPVVVFAALIATGARRLGDAFSKVSAAELVIRRITGAVFIVIGIYFTVSYIFKATAI